MNHLVANKVLFFSKYSAVIILPRFHLLIIEVANLVVFEILDICHKMKTN